MWDFIVSMMPYALAFTAPMLVTALGGLFSERSGVVNIGLEGLMIVGSFTTALFINQFYAGNDSIIWIGILLGGVAGCAFSLLHAYASINLKADQVISGTAINLLAPAVTIFLARTLTGSQNISIVKGVSRFDAPVLSNIPVIGPLFFSKMYLTTFIVLGLVILTWYIVFKTSFGLRLRACGEHPQAADSMGINVYKMRYIGVLASGFLAGLGGAIIIEQVFSWPGLGLMTMSAISNRDYPVIMGVCLLSAVVVLAANLITDIMYAVVDPTIQLK